MPMLSAPSSTATGGAAPAINPTTGRAALPFGASGAVIRGVDQGVVDDRRARHVRDAVPLDQVENLRRFDLAQADIDAGGRRDGPGKTPAVAVEHRQRPEIHRMLAELACEDVADRIEVSAAVVGDDALRITRGAGGVAQRDGFPFVRRQSWNEVGIALRQRVFIFDLADPPAAGESGIIDVDDERFGALHYRQALADD